MAEDEYPQSLDETPDEEKVEQNSPKEADKAQPTQPLQKRHEEEVREDPNETPVAQRKEPPQAKKEEENKEEPATMSPPPSSDGNGREASSTQSVALSQATVSLPPSSDDNRQDTKNSPLESKDIATLEGNILMKEIDVRSAEINARILSQMQSIASLVALLAGLVALAGFLIGLLHVPLIPWAPFIGLLYSFIALTFLWMNLDHDIQMADNGNYLESRVRLRLREILGITEAQDKIDKEDKKQFFSWGEYRIYESLRLMYKNTSMKEKWMYPASYISSVSRYWFMFILASFFLVMAVLIIPMNWKDVVSLGWGWGIIFAVSMIASIMGLGAYGYFAYKLASYFREAIEEKKAKLFGSPQGKGQQLPPDQGLE